MPLKNIYLYFVLAGVFFIEFYFSSFMGVFILALSLLLYGAFAYLIYIAWKKHKRENIIYFLDFFHKFLYKIINFIIILILLLGTFIVYNNEVAPASMPEIRLSNGEKTVVFQSMVHVGKQDFYDKVKFHLEKSKQSGYVYYYEGVQSGSKEDLAKFNKAMGIKFDKDLYKNFAKLYGVVQQENEDFLGIHNNLDFNVDMNLSDIIKKYEKKPQEGKRMELPIDVSKEILETLSALNGKELDLLVYINQGILNFIIKNSFISNTIIDNFGDKYLMDIIIHERNSVIANEIITSKHKKIFATYGRLHFEGIFTLLQENDPKWKIIGRKNYYPIQ